MEVEEVGEEVVVVEEEEAVAVAWGRLEMITSLPARCGCNSRGSSLK